MSKIITWEDNIKICNDCKGIINIDEEEYFESTDHNYMHRECGDKMLNFKENWFEKPFDYFNVFDMTMDGEVDEFWKLVEKE